MKMAIAGGGTGGHLFPGIAIAQEMSTRGHIVFFIGNRGRIEEKKVPEYGYEIEFVKGGQVKGVGILGSIRGLIATALGLVGAMRILARRKPAVVVGVGGYASVAGVLAAKLRGIKAVICEQNSIPGRANRFLARFVKIVFTAYEKAAERFPEEKLVLSGNPIRVDFKEKVEQYRKQMPDAKSSVFVFGGSQGARKINYATIEAVQIWMKQQRLPDMIHQTGSLDFEDVKQRYQQMNAPVDVREFIDDMPAAYAKAKLVVARAGAGSIAEIAAAGLPAIFVPLPIAADDHQRHNAAEFVETEAGQIIENDLLDGKTMVESVDQLLGDPEKLQQMGRASASFDRPDAVKVICDRIEKLAGVA